MFKLNLRTTLLVFLAAALYSLAGCTVDDDSSSDDDDATEVSISTDSNTSTITNSRLYNLVISGDRNTLTLEDNINNITVSGQHNTLIIEEDKQIAEITITGNNNFIQDSSVYNVTKIVTTGENNLIEVGSFGTWTDTQPDGSDTKNTVNASVSN